MSCTRLLLLAVAGGLATACVDPVWPADKSETLNRESWSAFEQGLLPVGDFLEHLAAAEEWSLARDSLHRDGRQTAKLLQPRLLLLRQAVDRMQEFQQPAAKDWFADLALLRYTLAHAEKQLAEVSGERSAVFGLSAAEARLASEHYQARVFDYRVLGQASLPAVAEAAALLNLAPGAEHAVRLEVLATTRRWGRAGAGIGRTDHVLEAEMALARSRSLAAHANPTNEEIQGFIDAERFSARLFDAELTYHQRGTATLADLTRAWRIRQQIHLQAQRSRIALPFECAPDLANDLQVLGQQANRVTDRRGRLRADLQYVELLQTWEASRNP